MSPETIRIATRKSPLALWQANYVRDALIKFDNTIKVELVEMTTKGDKILDTSLAKIGGKGLFVKELEQGLMSGEVDIAVHSMKDVPVALPDGLQLPVICQRGDARDAFVANAYSTFDALPSGARVGTSSLRRQCQLRAIRPDLEVLDVRGNVNTRLQKLDDGLYDAVILAVAGLRRLGLEGRIGGIIDVDMSLPAVGQGAVGIECRVDDARVNRLIAPLNDVSTSICVRAERALNERLEGGCQVPIAGYAVIRENSLWLRGLVGRPDGSEIIRGERSGGRQEAESIGMLLADDLLERGAGAILSEVHDQA